jgi:hypothetical protein
MFIDVSRGITTEDMKFKDLHVSWGILSGKYTSPSAFLSACMYAWLLNFSTCTCF